MAGVDENQPQPLVNSNASRPQPRPDTGSAFLDWFSRVTTFLLLAERRIDPWIRPLFDATLRDPIARLTTALINLKRPNEGLKIAEEKPLPNEEEYLDSIINAFTQQMQKLWKPGGMERGGNTKTHGICRGEFIVHDNLPLQFRHGIYAQPQTFRAWVRFSGPGPYITPDIDDVGFMSISIKLMGVPGPKLMDEEKNTLDMFGVSTQTFVTDDTKSNAHLQYWSLRNAQIFHFINFTQPHIADAIMQGLFIKTQSSPFEAPYFSCVPYLLGEGQAMQYSVWPKSNKKTPIPNLPFRPPDDYLRDAMRQSLAEGDVEFDIRLQLQTDPFLMPIEHNGVLWPEKLSPRVSVATLRLPKQKFDSRAQMEFAKKLSYNPWHTIAEHRPLGNQSRARKRMYYALSKLRHDLNAVPHYEPTGDEVFE
ncbi:MAG: catalase family protein [Chthoniobacterales bacterium]